MPDEPQDKIDEEINFFDMIPKNKTKLFLITGAILIGALLIVTAILSIYIAQYRMATFYQDYIQQNCACGMSYLVNSTNYLSSVI